jgi:hypothetical protein
VEFSKSAQSEIQSGTAVWTTILSSSATIGPIKVYGDCWVRATCSAGSVSVAVDPMGQAISTSSGSFGVPIPVTASRDITDNDDGETLRPTTFADALVQTEFTSVFAGWMSGRLAPTT